MKIAEHPQQQTTANTTHQKKISAHDHIIQLIKNSDRLQKRIEEHIKFQEDEVKRLMEDTNLNVMIEATEDFLADGVDAALSLIEDKKKLGYTIGNIQPLITINSSTGYAVVSLRKPEGQIELLKKTIDEKFRALNEGRLTHLVARHTEINNQIQELLPELKAHH